MPTIELYDSIQIAYVKGQIALLPLYLLYFTIPDERIKLEKRSLIRNTLALLSIVFTVALLFIPKSIYPMEGYLFPIVTINSSLTTVLAQPVSFHAYQIASAITTVSVTIFVLLFILQFTRERAIVNAAEQSKKFGRVRIIFSSKVMSPFSTGFRIVKIYFPYRLRADKASLLPILAHETAHIRQHHLLLDVLDKINVALGWYNPLAYLLFKNGIALREFECDQIVIKSYPAAEYGKILIKEAESISRAGKWALSSAFINHSLFKRRLLMLFERKTVRPRRMVFVFAVAAIMSSGFLLMVFSAAPQNAPSGKKDSISVAAKDVDVLAGRTQEAVNKTVMANIGELRKIYNDFLKAKPGLKGKVTLQFCIEVSGSVSKLMIKTSTTGDNSFDEAITKQVSAWDFGKNEKGGVATITYPFAFSK